MDKPEKRNYHGKEYNLHSFYVKSKNGKLSCSFMEPSAKYDKKMPVVIYMHGNASNKMEGLMHASKIVQAGINVCVFDFAGCGNSDGEIVTLGWTERYDLEAVINHIKSNYKVS